MCSVWFSEQTTVAPPVASLGDGVIFVTKNSFLHIIYVNFRLQKKQHMLDKEIRRLQFSSLLKGKYSAICMAKD
jgi:hypothetical protein